MHPRPPHGRAGARDGVAATGSPWWVDSLNVAANESYDVAFVANNPGIWMDHCHNLKHAADGMVAHLMYQGFDTPYRIARTGGQPARMGGRTAIPSAARVRVSSWSTGA